MLGKSALIPFAHDRHLRIVRFDAHNDMSSFRKPLNVLDLRGCDDGFFVEPCVQFTLNTIGVGDLYYAAPKSRETLGIRGDSCICKRPTAASTTPPNIRECTKQIDNDNIQEEQEGPPWPQPGDRLKVARLGSETPYIPGSFIPAILRAKLGFPICLNIFFICAY
jgi:hypothetical protein